MTWMPPGRLEQLKAKAKAEELARFRSIHDLLVTFDEISDKDRRFIARFRMYRPYWKTTSNAAILAFVEQWLAKEVANVLTK